MLHERLQRPSTRVETVHVGAARPSLVMKLKAKLVIYSTPRNAVAILHVFRVYVERILV